MDQTITIPDDIMYAVALLAALESITSNQYLDTVLARHPLGSPGARRHRRNPS